MGQNQAAAASMTGTWLAASMTCTRLGASFLRSRSKLAFDAVFSIFVNFLSWCTNNDECWRLYASFCGGSVFLFPVALMVKKCQYTIYTDNIKATPNNVPLDPFIVLGIKSRLNKKSFKCIITLIYAFDRY